MIETFTIKEEKFVNKTYNLKLGVSFNKKILEYLDRKNFSYRNKRRKFFYLKNTFLDQPNNDILVYSNNVIYDKWDSVNNKNYLIKYICP